LAKTGAAYHAGAAAGQSGFRQRSCIVTAPVFRQHYQPSEKIMGRARSILTARTTLSELVAHGRTLVAKLVPIRRAASRRRFGAMRGKARVDAAFFDPLSEDELRAWE
jgi:hypothetical protein